MNLSGNTGEDARAEQSETAKPPRLLVVDDEESVALTIGAVLQQEGYEVETASNGADAAYLLQSSIFDLVLTDLHMEGGDGLLVLEAVREHTPSTIAIVLTGFASIESAIAALRQGAYDYLVKPCIIDELKLTVRRGLDHQQLIVAEQRARSSLERLNRELEQRVEERTAELQHLNKELSEANRAKDIFLATLSHELRTPLTPVLGWVNLLRSGGNSDATLMTQGLDAIERNARLQARLIDDLLDISRIVSGKLRLEQESVDLCALTETAVETLRGEAAARGITLDVECQSRTPLVVRGSPVRLQQIVLNLLSNAIKFGSGGGRVGVRVYHDGSEAHLTVSDDGIGIAPEFLPHVFDLFRQADGSTTRQHGGLGLGLAIVRGLAEIHGGRVRAESEGLGRGARFIFTMPRVVSEVEEPQAETHEDTVLSMSLPVLVVDDSPDSLELLSMLFTRKGCTVLAAGSGREAIGLAETKLPGIVVSDLSMPDMDGYELLARLRRIPGMEEVPAIALSGYAMAEDRDRSLAAGFSVHMAKPVDPEELFFVIQQLTA